MKSRLIQLACGAALAAMPLFGASPSAPFLQSTRNDPHGNLTLLATPKAVALPQTLASPATSAPASPFMPVGSFLERPSGGARFRFVPTAGAVPAMQGRVRAAPSAQTPLERLQAEREAALTRKRELDAQREELEAEIRRIDHLIQSFPELR